MEQSRGHLAFVGRWEYFRIGNEVYRAATDYPLDVLGYRQGARFECFAHMADMMIGLARKAIEEN